jgi:hypothetical protein
MNTSSEDHSKDGKVPAAEKEVAIDPSQLLEQHSLESVPEIAPGYRDFSRCHPTFAHAAESDFQRFPQKLHEILSMQQYSHICSWLPHGRAWAVHNMPDFEQFVLPQHFRYGWTISFGSLALP